MKLSLQLTGRDSSSARLAVTLSLLLVLPGLLARADQTLSLSFSDCQGAPPQFPILFAQWGPNINNCKWPQNAAATNQAPSSGYRCIDQRCMNNCGGSCQFCNQKDLRSIKYDYE
jgi:hypothetical protein